MNHQLWVLVESLTGRQPEEPGIPFRLRIGVTGHRTLQDPASVARRVEEVLAAIETTLLPRSPVTPFAYTAVSALAEGADRLVAQVLLEHPGAELEVVLPLARAEYEQDFQSAESRAEFDALVARAVRPPDEPEHPQARPDAYASVGRAVVERSDMLIAVWDYEPERGIGGTAAVVEYAQEKKVPLFIISAVDSDRVEFATPPPKRPSLAYRFLDRLDLWLGERQEVTRFETLLNAYNGLDAFNRERVAPRRLEAAQERERGYAAPAAQRAGVDESFSDWVLPPFVRADLAAALYQWIHTRIAFAVFMFAAGAVTVAALVEIYFPERHHLILLEVGLMLAVALVVGFARWKRPHDRWISYRSLAENLRSAPFIAILSAREIEREFAADPFAPWFQRAFSEVWKRRPDVASVPRDAVPLREFLDDAWIGGQVGYHTRTGGDFNRRHRMLTLSIDALFLGTFLAALIDAFGWIEAKTLVFLAISLPAFGAALSGYRELRQYGLHAERYRRAGERLEDVRVRMLNDETAEDVKSRAAHAYSVMVEENLDWFGVVEFADLQIVI